MRATRVIRIFLSCPGDVAAERQRLDDVVHNVAAVFSPHGVHLVTWRFDRHAHPALGTDAQDVINRQVPSGYEIYVGIMCRRFGTPTGRFPSGTIEEFEVARKGWEEGGRPQVLFYFCRNPPPTEVPDEVRQREQVNSFRRRYPGLFASFDSAEELVAQFERHLVRVVLNLVLPSALPGEAGADSADAGSHRPSQRAWTAAAAIGADQAAAGWNGLLDYSSARPTRVIAKIEQLFDCRRLLSSFEQDVLLAAAYLQTAVTTGGQDAALAVAKSIGSASTAGWEVVASTGVAAATKIDPSLLPSPVVSDAAHAGPNVRTALLAALLRLGELLDLDVAGLSSRGRRAVPGVATPGAPPERLASCWAALLTREVRVQPGVVTYLLASPSEKWSLLIRRCTALRLEVEWQRRRNVLTRHGFALAVAPSEVTIAVGDEPPSAAVGEELRALSAEVLGNFPAFRHLGETTVHASGLEPPKLSDLLPLPESGAAGPVIVPLAPGDYDHIVEVNPLDGKNATPSTRIVAPAGRDQIVLGSELLSPEGYTWTLYRNYGDGELLQATGIVRPLSTYAAMAKAVDDQIRRSEARSPRLAAAGLWNDWLLEVWPAIVQGAAAPEDLSLAFDVVTTAYEQSRKFGRHGVVRTSAYRNAANWMKTILQF